MKLAILASAAAIAVYAGATAVAPPVTANHPAAAVTIPPVTHAALRQGLRELWTDHVVWTRSYIIASIADAPDATEVVKRLMKNQEEIGAAVAGFYGTAVGDRLTMLLKEHIAQAADLIKAAKAGDKAGQQAMDKKWHENAESIADFLAGANPNWKRSDLRGMMKSHLATTTDEVVARLKQDWAADVKAYDHAYDHILKMSDALADGIAKQFPAKVTADK